VRVLPLPWQFRLCYETGRKVVTRHAIVFARAGADADTVRVGVVASRKVGGAVRRNRAKRLLREAARSFADRWTDRRAWVVFVARASTVKCTAGEIRNDIERALIEAGLLEPGNIE
jgi:ribonuclease P protein component